MKDNLQTILLKKYQDKSLASLYIANYDSRSTDPELWVNEFMGQLTSITDHPDVLKIVKTAGENEYKVDSTQIRDFLKFINYRPLQLDKKFIYFFDAQDISIILSNKLLKIFEELGSDLCLFLMVPDNAHIIPTVLSRAVKLQIPRTKELMLETPDFSSVTTPQELLTLLKQNRNNSTQDEKRFIEEAIQRVLTQSISTPEAFADLDQLLRTLADNEVFSNFNNSKLSRITRFFP